MNVLNKWYEPSNFSYFHYRGINRLVSGGFHKLLEKGRGSKEYPTVLELAATHGAHAEFVRHNYREYILSDLLLSEELISAAKQYRNCRAMGLDARNMTEIESHKVDRIISTCLFHHLSDSDIKDVIKSAERVMSSSASVFDILLPNEPSLLWKTGRALLIYPKLLIKRIPFAEYRAYTKADHINTYKKVSNQIQSSALDLGFKISKSYWPIPVNLGPLNVYVRVSLEKV